MQNCCDNGEKNILRFQKESLYLHQKANSKNVVHNLNPTNMKEKEVKPISFKEENLQEGVQLQKNTIQQASTRGSGSGESKEEGNFGDGRGVISSVNGGTWNANCSFYWTAKYKYEKIMNINVITEVEISFNNMRAYCEGTTSGNKVDGTCYETFNHEIEVNVEGFTKDSSFGIQDISFTRFSKETDLKVTITKYNKKGEVISSETKTEKKSLTLDFDFAVNDSIPEIRLRSCNIS